MATIEEEIRQSVTDILTDSSKCPIAGQGLFQPRYLTMQQAKDSVTAALLEHEPRINVTRVDVHPAQDIGVEIYLKYSIKEEVIMAELEELTQRVVVLESSVTDLQANVGTNQTDITALQADVGTNQTDILTLDSRLDTAEANQVTTNNAIAALEGRVTALETFRDNQGMLVAYHATSPGTNAGNPIGSVNTWAIVPINSIAESSGSLTGSTVDQIANEITVPPGEYKITAKVYGCGVKRFQGGIIANDTIIALGQSVAAPENIVASGYTMSQTSEIYAARTFTVSTRIRLTGIYAHYHTSGVSLGVAVFGSPPNQVSLAQGTEERYSSLVIERVG